MLSNLHQIGNNNSDKVNNNANNHKYIKFVILSLDVS